LSGFAIGARVSLLWQHSAEREMSASACTRSMPRGCCCWDGGETICHCWRPRLSFRSFPVIRRHRRPRQMTSYACLIVKAKFHYASCFEAGSKLVAGQLGTVCDQLRTSFELASVMEFGFNGGSPHLVFEMLTT